MGTLSHRKIASSLSLLQAPQGPAQQWACLMNAGHPCPGAHGPTALRGSPPGSAHTVYQLQVRPGGTGGPAGLIRLVPTVSP